MKYLIRISRPCHYRNNPSGLATRKIAVEKGIKICGLNRMVLMCWYYFRDCKRVFILLTFQDSFITYRVLLIHEHI